MVERWQNGHLSNEDSGGSLTQDLSERRDNIEDSFDSGTDTVSEGVSSGADKMRDIVRSAGEGVDSVRDIDLL